MGPPWLEMLFGGGELSGCYCRAFAVGLAGLCLPNHLLATPLLFALLFRTFFGRLTLIAFGTLL